MEAAMPVPAVIESWAGSLAGRAFWTGAMAWISKLKAGRIQITSPRPLEQLEDRQVNARGGVSYKVRGKLKKLPTGHQIWLLIEDEIPRKFWPQSGYAVQFDPTTGEWHGRVNDKRAKGSIKIIAVVAPPTSQQFFRYYEKVSEKTKWEPLDEIPPECINQAHVQGQRS
jgi:hypothetical protein